MEELENDLPNDSTLSEAEYLSKYNFFITDGKLTQEYLRTRWKWMQGKSTWQEVCEAYMRTPAAKII